MNEITTEQKLEALSKRIEFLERKQMVHRTVLRQLLTWLHETIDDLDETRVMSDTLNKDVGLIK